MNEVNSSSDFFGALISVFDYVDQGSAGEMMYLEPDESEVLRILNNLSEDQKERVWQIIKPN